MANLIKMDMRRLFLSKVFYLTMGIVAVLNIAILTAVPMIVKLFTQGETSVVNLSDILVNPFFISWSIIAMYISVVSYFYADMANGYVKNIAGQIHRRSDTVFSKLAVIGVHNLIFIAVGALSIVIGNLIGSTFGTYTIAFDGQVLSGVLTLLLKWLLSMAVCSILLLMTTGVRNKTLATIIGVILGTNTLGLVYFGLDTAVANIFHTTGFSMSMYMPDSLIEKVNVAANTGIINAVVVSLVCIAVFMMLTVRVFNRRDIK